MVAAALAAGGLLVAGCLGGGSSGSQQRSASAGRGVGQPVSTASCGDWRRASPAQRAVTVRQVRAFAGGPAGGEAGGRGAVLGAAQAYDVLQRECAAPYARGFKLYKLYTRAAAFSGR